MLAKVDHLCVCYAAYLRSDSRLLRMRVCEPGQGRLQRAVLWGGESPEQGGWLYEPPHATVFRPQEFHVHCDFSSCSFARSQRWQRFQLPSCQTQVFPANGCIGVAILLADSLFALHREAWIHFELVQCAWVNAPSPRNHLHGAAICKMLAHAEKLSPGP